ncbi:MAG: L-serine ammonia-lyase, iron-sulfur-dependent, subunit alpha, partial [Lachnospiraceae bacterium]|nr:L-serine ammonia-lyase, iron-sulfur-dependent, subunit alpha [Lachnospiraceae bacterium]
TVMQESAMHGKQADIRSTSGLSGGDACKMAHYHETAGSLSGDFCAAAISTAIAIAEYNASMGRIVAAPTAGSCGILPAAVLTMMEKRNISRQDACMALVLSGGVGMVIANVASIAGATGGCQAECGSAAAMAAAALVELNGGTPEMVGHAMAISIKNQLGLVCDPVAGLVEVPCIKRNAGSIMCAIMAADLALAGVKSVIPVDEVISAMNEVGATLPCALRETAQGGLATTPTGMKLAESILKST